MCGARKNKMSDNDEIRADTKPAGPRYVRVSGGNGTKRNIAIGHASFAIYKTERTLWRKGARVSGANSFRKESLRNVAYSNFAIHSQSAW